MSLRQYTSSLLNRRLKLADREEELLRQQAAQDAKMQAAGLSVIPSLVKGAVDIGQTASDLQERELQRDMQLAQLAGAGQRKQAPKPVQPQAQPQALPPDMSDAGERFVEGQDPDTVEMQEVVAQKPDLSGETSSMFGAPQPAPETPKVKPLVQQAQEQVSKEVEAKNEPVVQKAAESSSFSGIEWEMSPEEEAKAFVAETIAKKAPNPFMNLITFGQAQGNFDRAKMLAEKMATNSIIQARQKVEEKAFDNWAKRQQIESERIRALNATNPELMAAKIELAKAQADKARKSASGTIGIKMTGKAVDDLRTGQNASKAVETVSGLFNELVKPEGEGLPSTLALQKLKQKVLAAAADVDASGASVGGGVSALGGGLSASISGSQGGKYVDDKIIDGVLDEIDKLEMSPKQREFLRESLLMTQMLGKAREGGRMTDSDLRFYLNNLLNAETPEAMAAALQRRADETRMDYSSIYGAYVGDEPRWSTVFKDPNSFKFNFDLNNYASFGYKSPEEFAAAKLRWQQKDLKRMEQLTKNVSGGASEAGRLGFGRKSASPAKLVTEETKEAVKQVGKMVSGGDSSNNPPPKRKGSF